MSSKKIAIIGAGPAGLMAAEVLSHYYDDIQVYEQKPSAARKFLMAGKTGLNISHAEPIEKFINRYDHPEWLEVWIRRWDAVWIQNWMKGLGIDSYIGSSGRIFPVEMKAAPLLRAWLKRLVDQKVKFYYRHQVKALQQNHLTVLNLQDNVEQTTAFDAIILACGAVSWSQLGSDGAWRNWLSSDEMEAFQASNAGVVRKWSRFMHPVFGQPLKRVHAWVDPKSKSEGDIIITHYGLESGLVYRQGRDLRSLLKRQNKMWLYLDLLPDLTIEQLIKKLQPAKKQSLNNIWRKAGLDTVKSNLIRELVDKELWAIPELLAKQIKNLKIELDDFRPIEEAISCAGGVKQEALTENLQLKSNPYVFCAGEMLDWDAPTGGYLLTACFATGRAAGEGVYAYLEKQFT
ncbi:TIGR03862 family flavoprotein [Acinetobacter stercoris]|uniref:Dihydropyrimidine dehydrogenase subunit A n=1 Tax=Acinetobacter stercoris TaxID=2126983 RepID=A0A2U3N1Y6_9GAMM|nr:TIGR03862 family flavoprotein [Acinetobacter stercoris]SPL71635.1 dihydropyrimidine dehydrogenase subunit A [Acinetobacter stercoris]